MEAVLLIGIQGSGKSTFYRERFAGTHVRVSLDVEKTRARERALFDSSVRAGDNLVIDNTNVRRAERGAYINAAKAAGYRVIGYFFDVPLRQALGRNKLRSGREWIPAPGVIGTFKRLERPDLSEGFDELHIVPQNEAAEVAGR